MIIHSAYQNLSNFAKQHISASNLDLIEVATSVAGSGALGYLGSSLVLSNPILSAVSLVGCAVAGCYLFHKFLKGPAIEREIESIVKGSKDDTKPTSLFIHTKNDFNGACTDCHAVVEPYRTGAQGFSLDRIRGLDYEERIKVQGKKYDIILLSAHASPFSISMDGDGLFFGFHAGRKKQIDFLASRVKVGGKIILDCCSTAQGDDNIAQSISKSIPDATVYGSSTSVHALFGSQYAPDMTPTFKGGIFCQRNTTRAYKNGASIPLQN